MKKDISGRLVKRCPRCGFVKDRSEFFKEVARGDGLSGICKKCKVEYQRRPDVAERIRKYNRERSYALGIHRPMSDNKDCSCYPGVVIAERVLGEIFDSIEVMPCTNPGFDFRCSNGYTIDVKFSSRRTRMFVSGPQDSWMFNIKKNRGADYFLCLASDYGRNFNFERLWLIPKDAVTRHGKPVCDIETLTITDTDRSLKYWSMFERPIDLSRAVEVCNGIRNKSEEEVA